jgi:ElaB/YqjD/DUF883 family membrane-anchored ribosome-binding protein
MMREQLEVVVVPHPIEMLDNVDDDLDRIELWTAALSCFQHPAPEYEPDPVTSDEREGRREEVGVPTTEVFDNLDGDLDRIELWTAALSCFQHSAPGYKPDTVMSDEREGAVGSLVSEPRDRTADVGDPLKSHAEDLYGQARDSASQIADAARMSMKVPRHTASSLEDALRNTIEEQPYTAVAIALGLGWLLGRTHRPL